jgi:hypothetical protein
MKTLEHLFEAMTDGEEHDVTTRRQIWVQFLGTTNKVLASWHHEPPETGVSLLREVLPGDLNPTVEEPPCTSEAARELAQTIRADWFRVDPEERALSADAGEDLDQRIARALERAGAVDIDQDRIGKATYRGNTVRYIYDKLNLYTRQLQDSLDCLHRLGVKVETRYDGSLQFKHAIYPVAPTLSEFMDACLKERIEGKVNEGTYLARWAYSYLAPYLRQVVMAPTLQEMRADVLEEHPAVWWRGFERCREVLLNRLGNLKTLPSGNEASRAGAQWIKENAPSGHEELCLSVWNAAGDWYRARVVPEAT